MAGSTLNDLLGKPRRTGIGQRIIQDILTDALGPRPKVRQPISLLDEQVDLNTATPEQVAALTQNLQNAREDTGFSGATEAFDVLDIPGAFVRGLVGSGISLAKGEFKEAGLRALSALPGSENIPKALGLGAGVRAPEGSELLADVGVEPGTTAEDERRIRIAMAAGLDRGTARQKFATLTSKPLAFDAQREFDAMLEKVKATNPQMDLGVTFEDTKKAVDAQDFLGAAVEIALDPLTYFTLGASAAGKAARLVAQAEKAGGKGLLSALKSAVNLDDAAKAVRALDIPGFGPKAKQRLLDSLGDAFKGGKPNFDLGATLAEQARRGQRRAGFKIPFGPEFGPELSTLPVDQVLSTIGQSKLARAASEVPAGVDESVYQFLTETPVIGQAVRGARGVIELGRKVTGKTGVATFDEAFKAGLEASGTGASRAERGLTEQEAAIRKLVQQRGMDKQTVDETVALAIETFKARGKSGYSVSDPTSERLAAQFAAALSRTGLKESEVAPIAAGIAAVQEDVLAAGHKMKLDIKVTDDALDYLHRHATDEGKKWLKTQEESSVFQERIKKWRDLPISEINKIMEKELGPGKKFFTDDPIAATRKAVSETWRHLGNAYTASKIVEGFGRVAEDAAFEAAYKTDDIAELTERVVSARKRANTLSDNLMKDIRPETERVGNLLRDARWDLEDAKKAAESAPKKPPMILGGRKPLSEVDRAEERVRALTKTYRKLDVLYRAAEKNRDEAQDAYRLALSQLDGARAQARMGVREKGGTVDVVKNSAADLYKTMGLKVADDELARLSKIEVPEEIHKATMEMVKAQKEPGKALRAWMKLTNALKATVTLPFPAFHGRNMLENSFKSLMEGNANPENFREAAKLLANVKDLNAGGWGKIAEAGRKFHGAAKAALGDIDPKTLKLLREEGGFKSVDEFIDWANGTGLMENRFTSEFGVDMRTALRGRDATKVERAGEAASALFGAPLKAGFAVASGTENWYRLSMFIDRLKKGLGRDGALNDVKRVFFDYRDLGKMESDFARKFGFFYNFYRNNMRYLVQQGLTRPVLMKQITRLFQDDPDNPRFSWMSDKGAFKLAGMDVSLGFLPQQQFNMFDLSEGDWFDKVKGKLGDAIGQANPLIDSALSAAFGKDLYRNQDLQYVDRAPDWSFAPQWMQQMIGLRQTSGGGYVMSPKWRWFMDAVPAMGRFAQTQISLEKPDRQLWSVLAQVLAGVRIEKGDLTKDSIALLDRNIRRAGQGMPEIREDGPNNWRIDRRTEEGRKINALTKTRPDKDDLIALSTDPEIIGRLAPYISVGEDGEPVMNRLLVAKMQELGMEKYPRHWALMRSQQARDAAKLKTVDIFKQRADAAFASLFGGQ